MFSKRRKRVIHTCTQLVHLLGARGCVSKLGTG